MRYRLMPLTIFGSAGGTGREIVRAALDSGRTVTAVARNPSRIEITHERLRTVSADVLDRSSLEGTMEGSDAVVSALGAPSGREPTTVYSAGVANILDAMSRAGVRRFIGISDQPVGPHDEVGVLERRLAYPVLYRFFGESYADMKRMERVLHDSEAEWTIMRPPRLTDGSGTGHYRTTVNEHLRRGRTISRADLAAAMLVLLDDPRTIRAAVGIAY